MKVTPAPKATVSLVVLPFANTSLDSDTDYFADGLTEEVIADLSSVHALRVIARNSAMRLKGTDKDVPTIGRELTVTHVLAGSVRRAGNQLRITAQLAEAAADKQVWAGKFSGTIEDVFDLQERLAREIVASLKLALTPEEQSVLAERQVYSTLVYELLLRARQELYKTTKPSLDRAIGFLEE